MEPSYKDTQYGFNDNLTAPCEVYRNTLITQCRLMSSSEFERLQFNFKAQEGESGEELRLQFAKEDFEQLEGSSAESLIKTAVHSELEKMSDKEARVAMSVQYQVLCDETAIVGVQKQLNETTGEMEESTVNFGKENVQEPNDYDDEIQFGQVHYVRELDCDSESEDEEDCDMGSCFDDGSDSGMEQEEECKEDLDCDAV